ncbi:MAG: GNAT family N-acetyltransferase [Ruminococcaceae bacterium]|nr:GNAT family N-acetyltransferase [Oscillospiraceae bacterium]
MNNKIVKLTDRPEMKESMATWFHQKWGIPREAYQDSMDTCLESKGAVPAWYVAMQDDRIIGGVGVIENDFHDRPDLAPNVCALFVEPDARGQGMAGKLLDFVCNDMKEAGMKQLYLVTDHTSFYERYGWEFVCMVQGNGESQKSRMYVRNL